jgi:hypothetical protein
MKSNQILFYPCASVSHLWRNPSSSWLRAFMVQLFTSATRNLQPVIHPTLLPTADCLPPAAFADAE